MLRKLTGSIVALTLLVNRVHSGDPNANRENLGQIIVESRKLRKAIVRKRARLEAYRQKKRDYQASFAELFDEIRQGEHHLIRLKERESRAQVQLLNMEARQRMIEEDLLEKESTLLKAKAQLSEALEKMTVK